MLAVLSLAIFYGGVKQEPKMTDENSLQGTWQLVAGERHGTPFPTDVVRNVTLVFTGETLITSNKGQETKATYKLRPKASPAEIDVDMDGNVGKGIFRLDGDDLTILHGEVSEDRPTKFDARETPSRTLLILKRVKK